MIRRSCLAGIVLSYLPVLVAGGLVAAVAAWAGAFGKALYVLLAALVGYAQLYGSTRHQRLRYYGGVRAPRESQPELAAVVDEVMARAGIRRLDGVWLVPGGNAGALIGRRDWLGRRHLGLTVGLLTAAHLDTAELKAILAHEAGHLTDTSRLRRRLCARRRHASAKLQRRGSRLMWWYWTWFLTVTRQLALDSERHADRTAASMCGAQLAARAGYRVAEASALHAVTIRQIVQPLWDRGITPATLLEAYDLVWTHCPGDITASLEAWVNAPEAPGDTHPGLAERYGGNRYPLAPGLRGDVPLARLADLDRKCSAILAREQRHLMTAMSWGDIRAELEQEASKSVLAARTHAPGPPADSPS